jgi:hypothetical protein
VGVGVESRLVFAEAAVRVRGQQAAKELLGLRLGQVRPQAVLLLRPREAGTARIIFEGAAHSIRLDIEASTLGTAQDVELRVTDEKPAGSAPPSPAPTPRPTPKTVTPRSSGRSTEPTVMPQAESAASPPLLLPWSVATPVVTASSQLTPLLDVAGASSEASVAATESPALESSRPVSRVPYQVARIGRRVGLPGQRGVVIEELTRENDLMWLRLRVENGAGTVEIKSLEIGDTSLAVRTEVLGKDLVVIGEMLRPLMKPREAMLAITEGGKSRRERLKLVGPGLADLALDGGREW